MLTLGNLQTRRNRGENIYHELPHIHQKIGKTLKKNYQMKIELIKNWKCKSERKDISEELRTR